MNLRDKKYNNMFSHILIAGMSLFLFTSCTIEDTVPPPPDAVEVFEQENQVPVIPTDDLLELVQERTFRYFWDFAEPVSGMARERSQNGPDSKLVTIGGSGFGISSFPAAVERGWITREEAIDRLQRILTFLENAETYHGAFSHWYEGDTGQTIPFSTIDDGGDLVETAFLIQGLLINRQYFTNDTEDEGNIRSRIRTIWQNVEWSWYERDQNVITWHWSENFGFDLDLQVRGWNEALIVYVLGASSPTFSISKETYDNGWARNGDMINNKSFFGVVLPVGEDFGGPLFLSQYSFIGLDPRNLVDQYANYAEQVRAHSLINFNHCVENPNGFRGYSRDSWGLTASDEPGGYGVHSPTEDNGVITPTAALSSFPFTPVESLRALEHFYYQKNDVLWGEFGFFDAFSESAEWVADGYLAIDQGPIIAMIENHRTQLLWTLFMSDPDVQGGLTKLGFTF